MASLGQDALAITDHGTMAGALHHVHACSGKNFQGERVHEPIKPIAGMEAYFRIDRKDQTQQNREYYHLVLLAKNLEGWHNLLRLSSEAYASGFYYKPCIDIELLSKHSEGLIASTSCLSGYVPQMLLAGEDARATQHVRLLQAAFGDDLFVEIQPHDFDEQRRMNVELANLATRMGIMLVATTDAHYPHHDWADTHDVLVMSRTGQSVATREKAREAGEDYMAFSGDTFYIMSEQEVLNAFAAHHPSLPESTVQEAVSNTLEIAGRVEHYEVSREPKVPKATRDAAHAEEVVRGWCEEGLVRVGKSDDARYREQLEHEMAVLRSKEVLDYFVVIGDLVRWAKDNRIRVGPGRGSAAGSLVSYLTRITAIDPIGHGLLFERFINPHRAEYPDIDIDFQHDRRFEVKQHLRDRWGADHVAEVGAYQTFGMRSAIQVPARCLDVPYEEVMSATRSLDDLDDTGDMGLAQLGPMSEKLTAFGQKYPDVIKHALRLEGQIKTMSKHAAGVVVTDKPISEYMPTRVDDDGSIITQWSEKAEFPIITEFGFMKIDVLATDGLTIQQRTVDAVKARTGREIDFEDVQQFPVIEDPNATDDKVLQLYRDGHTLGLFQFESGGITRFLKEIRPTWFGDLVAANALFRPGPLEGGVANDYGLCKNGIKPTAYWHVLVEPILAPTYGVMAYQEQVIQVVQALGDFDAGQADLVRKAMTKWQSTKIKTNKGRGEMQKFYEQFEAGCTAKGVTKGEASSIWEKVLQFSIYGFNKSHSAGYALQSYQDACLKTYEVLDFYASLLTLEEAKIARVIREAMGMGVQILPPDINESNESFIVSNNAVRFGLSGIKGVGDAIARHVMERRPFDSYDDMMTKIEISKCNSRARQALCEAGAFDCWGARSKWVLEKNDKDELVRVDRAYGDDEIGALERSRLGFSLSTNALRTGDDVLAKRLDTEDEFDMRGDGEPAIVGGEVTAVKEITDRKGGLMAFVDLAWRNNTYSATFFSGVYAPHRHLLSEGNVVLVHGSKDADRGNMIADAAMSLVQLMKALNGS